MTRTLLGKLGALTRGDGKFILDHLRQMSLHLHQPVEFLGFGKIRHLTHMFEKTRKKPLTNWFITAAMPK